MEGSENLSESIAWVSREVRTSPNQLPGFQDDRDDVVQFSVFTGVAESWGGRRAVSPRGGGTGLVVGSPSLFLPALPRVWGSGRSQALLKILQSPVLVPPLVTQPGQLGTASRGGRQLVVAAPAHLGVLLPPGK